MRGQFQTTYLIGTHFHPKISRFRHGLYSHSSLGRYDGRVYEDMFNRAHRLNPLNKVTFNPDYRTEEIIKGSGDGGKILSKL